jgi:hypothetical protein
MEETLVLGRAVDYNPGTLAVKAVAAPEHIIHPDQVADDNESNLCEVCSGITEENTRFHAMFPYEEKTSRVYAHHKNLLALRKSAHRGCRLCDLMFRALSFKPHTRGCRMGKYHALI